MLKIIAIMAKIATETKMAKKAQDTKKAKKRLLLCLLVCPQFLNFSLTS